MKRADRPYCQVCWVRKAKPPALACPGCLPEWIQMEEQRSFARVKAAHADVQSHLDKIVTLRKQALDVALAIKANQFAIEKELQRALGVTHGIGLGWQECNHSPTGRCFYDDDDDCAHDNCIMCGMPSERGKL